MFVLYLLNVLDLGLTVTFSGFVIVFTMLILLVLVLSLFGVTSKLKEKQALKDNDFNEFLRLVNESGNSSYKYLQNVYSTSNVHMQGVSLALALTEQFLQGTNVGAYRVHGGGFAGTILCFIPKELLLGYKKCIEKVFGKPKRLHKLSYLC